MVRGAREDVIVPSARVPAVRERVMGTGQAETTTGSRAVNSARPVIHALSERGEFGEPTPCLRVDGTRRDDSPPRRVRLYMGRQKQAVDEQLLAYEEMVANLEEEMLKSQKCEEELQKSKVRLESEVKAGQLREEDLKESRAPSYQEPRSPDAARADRVARDVYNHRHSPRWLPGRLLVWASQASGPTRAGMSGHATLRWPTSQGSAISLWARMTSSFPTSFVAPDDSLVVADALRPPREVDALLSRRLLSRPLSRRSFLFDPVATDLISFEADGCNSTGYSPLGDPLLSFTGRDPFFGAPYCDASRLNEDHSPSQASNGLYQLFETHALMGPSPAQSPLAGLSPSAARLTAQIAAPSPSYRGHSGVGGNALTDSPWSRAQRVDDVVCKPARLTDNVAAFTDACWRTGARTCYGRARVGAVTAARNCGAAPKRCVGSGALVAFCFKGRPRVPSAKHSD
ncbi:hypothetical protein HPB51_027536 [Rhipicephalus microplus]|uniref:Uncharacterized protein n=1 Tax=Rhipicephalus microplus TaxID=6941 RepID=A0A9J6CZT9_RHIMP|nr:hypothetical protein HPB51_027536 [Rhipicephalus microplus]